MSLVGGELRRWQMTNRGIAAINHQLLTKHEVGRRAREKHDGIGNFRRISKPSRRKFAHVIAAEFSVVCEFPRHVRDVKRRSHGVDVDSILTPLGRQRACHQQKSALRRAVSGEQRKADLGPYRGDVNDLSTSASFDEVLRCGLRKKERRFQVRRQGLVPIFLGEVLSWRQQLHAGVVNENMQVAEVLDDVIDEFAQRGDAAQVDGIRFGASALCFGRLYGFVQRRLFTRSDSDVSAGVGECIYDSASDAAASAGDECDFPRKAELVHERSPVIAYATTTSTLWGWG